MEIKRKQVIAMSLKRKGLPIELICNFIIPYIGKPLIYSNSKNISINLLNPKTINKYIEINPIKIKHSSNESYQIDFNKNVKFYMDSLFLQVFDFVEADSMLFGWLPTISIRNEHDIKKLRYVNPFDLKLDSDNIKELSACPVSYMPIPKSSFGTSFLKIIVKNHGKYQFKIKIIFVGNLIKIE
jgi:hypothetical protein